MAHEKKIGKVKCEGEGAGPSAFFVSPRRTSMKGATQKNRKTTSLAGVAAWSKEVG